MNLLKTVKLFYALYTIYTLFILIVSDYPVRYAFWGLLAIWLVYIAFSAGYRTAAHSSDLAQKLFDNSTKFPYSDIANWKTWQYALNAAICCICSVAAVRFYTGLSIVSVFENIRNQTSNYALYQRHFIEAEVGTLSLSKIPYILMMAYVVIMLYYSTIGIVLSNRKLKAGQILYLGLVTLSYVYIAMARGTNFEYYVLFIIIVYCLLNRYKMKKMLNKNVVLLFALGFLLILAFETSISNRGFRFNYELTAEITYDTNNVFARVMPSLTFRGVTLFSYLGYGIYMTGVMLRDVVLASLSNFAFSFLPTGYQLFHGNSLQSSTKEIIDIGVRWTPDYVLSVNALGFILFYIMVFALGYIASSIRSLSVPRFLFNLMCMVIFMQMVSIPVGNFLWNSSSHILLALSIIFWWFKCLLSSKTNIKTEMSGKIYGNR